jgi:PAS domain S-box-containing protein
VAGDDQVREELRAWQEELEEQAADIARERSQCQALFECAPDAYLLTDAATVIRQANGAAARLLGVEPRFLAGKPMANFVDETGRRGFLKQLDLLCGTEQSEPWSFDLRRRDGNTATVEVSIAKVRPTASRSMELRWLLRDVSKQRRAELRIRHLNATMEQRVAERTRELAERTQQLEQAIGERDALLQALSHAVRMPLHSILGYGGLLGMARENGNSAEVQACLARIGRNTEDVLTAIDRLRLAPVALRPSRPNA